MRYEIDDTIAAISTAAGEGGIGIVRLSGPESLFIADKIFKAKDGVSASNMKTHTVRYGHIVSPSQEIVDEVLLTVMKAPATYTKEDIVEINCHGGIVPLKKVLELALSMGARPAGPGEFTKRAFLNGRIDLAQAESVLDIISAKTGRSLRAAMGCLRGGLSDEIRDLSREIGDILSFMEASIDFPEEELNILPAEALKKQTRNIIRRIEVFIGSAQKGRILTEGLRTVICGRPNVGKSSLMNFFLKEKRVIVSHIPGTTRDAIEDMINIDGIPLRIVDTAGIAKIEGPLMKESVERSRAEIRAADLVILLLDASSEFCGSDKTIVNEVEGKDLIVVVNKIDIERKPDIKALKKVFIGKEIVEISVTKKKNLEKLEDAISRMVWGGRAACDHTTLITAVRHKVLLIRAKEALERALKGMDGNASPELIVLDAREAMERLGGITGETAGPDVLDTIFSRFCIGK